MQKRGRMQQNKQANEINNDQVDKWGNQLSAMPSAARVHYTPLIELKSVTREFDPRRHSRTGESVAMAPPNA